MKLWLAVAHSRSGLTYSLASRLHTAQWEEGTVCIRMKMDMNSGNPCMWDPVAFRVKFHPHVRTGVCAQRNRMDATKAKGEAFTCA